MTVRWLSHLVVDCSFWHWRRSREGGRTGVPSFLDGERDWSVTSAAIYGFQSGSGDISRHCQRTFFLFLFLFFVARETSVAERSECWVVPRKV